MKDTGASQYESLHDGTGVYSAADQNAILQGLEADYAAFNSPTFDLIQFSLTAPTEAEAPNGYETVYFNETPIVNGQPSPGGFSSEIDFRNLNLNTTMFVDVNGFLGTRPRSSGRTRTPISSTCPPRSPPTN